MSSNHTQVTSNTIHIESSNLQPTHIDSTHGIDIHSAVNFKNTVSGVSQFVIKTFVNSSHTSENFLWLGISNGTTGIAGTNVSTHIGQAFLVPTDCTLSKIYIQGSNATTTSTFKIYKNGSLVETANNVSIVPNNVHALTFTEVSLSAGDRLELSSSHDTSAGQNALTLYFV